MKKKPFLYHVQDAVYLAIDTICNYYILKANGVTIGKKVRINGKIWIKSENKGSLCIGDRVVINSGFRNNPAGGADKRVVFWTRKNGKIVVGNDVGISNSVIASETRILIEDKVFIGGGTQIYDTDFHSIDDISERLKYEQDINIKSKEIWIKEGAFIGAGVIILKGVIIGKQSIIGAGAVVTTNVPDYEIWAGNPAHFIRKVKIK